MVFLSGLECVCQDVRCNRTPNRDMGLLLHRIWCRGSRRLTFSPYSLTGQWQFLEKRDLLAHNALRESPAANIGTPRRLGWIRDYFRWTIHSGKSGP